jgi:hypothetical protein
MVGQAALNRSIGVRLPVSQPPFCPFLICHLRGGERQGLDPRTISLRAWRAASYRETEESLSAVAEARGTFIASTDYD